MSTLSETEMDVIHTGIQCLFQDVTYKEWSFYIGRKGDVIYLQVQFLAEDSDKKNSKMSIQKGRKWMLSKHMSKSEIIQTALKAVLTAEEHEIREQFKYRGKAVFAPHIDVDVLHKLDDDDYEVRTPIEKKNNGTKN